MTGSDQVEPVVVGTVVSKSHLADARALAWSLADSQPDSRLYCLLADRVDDYFDPAEEPFELITLEQLDNPERIRQMCFYYTPFELCNALKGELHHYLWSHLEVSRWLYLDGDIMVVGNLQAVLDRLDDAEILLNPHRTLPHEPEWVDPYEILLLRIGLFNGGFLGLRRGMESKKFLEWYRSRLQRYAFYDHVRLKGGGWRSVALQRGLNADQLWLNLVPVFFERVEMERGRGVNVAHWNIDGPGSLSRVDGEYRVSGEPLRFMHFSGWNVERPRDLSKYSRFRRGWSDPVWTELAERYRDYLTRAHIAETRRWPYGFARFAGGRTITQEMRRRYWSELQAGTWGAEDPFDEAERFAGRWWRGLRRVLRR